MRIALLSIAVMLGVVGCAGELGLSTYPSSTYTYDDYGYAYYAPSRPPAPYDEYVGVAPGRGYVWVNGRWVWRGNDWTWERGRWERPPQRGYVWLHGGWSPHRDRYGYYQGRWVPRRDYDRYYEQRVYVHPRPRVYVRPQQGYYRAVPHYRYDQDDRTGYRERVRVRPRYYD
jgi:hypothetical protein